MILLLITTVFISASCSSFAGSSDRRADDHINTNDKVELHLAIMPEAVTPAEFRSGEFAAGGGMMLRPEDVSGIIVKHAGGRRYRLKRLPAAHSEHPRLPQGAVLFRRTLPPGEYFIQTLIFDTDYQHVRGEMRFSLSISGSSSGSSPGGISDAASGDTRGQAESSLETGVTVGRYLSVRLEVENRPSVLLEHPEPGVHSAGGEAGSPAMYEYRIRTGHTAEDVEHLLPGEADIELLSVSAGSGGSAPVQRITP
ncbi:hypothetical protein L21SP2_0186 [Salinispira pacifica]|uniref:Uncharacterized protein n=2 Tax=Salinispira pacifica TaxID=1307761 RepID=V5WDF1_9SPIO|nr:hypothetical protein L21SP2_0186 [Salinispira pacifica]